MVPKQATTALDVHLALEIGSRVLDRHRVPSAAAPTLSLQGPFKGADPPPHPAPKRRLGAWKRCFKNQEGGSWQVATSVREAFAQSNKNAD